MDTDSATDAGVEVVSSRPERGGRKAQAVEVGVFLFLIFPSMALSFFAIRQGRLDFGLVAVATILRDLGLLGLVLFFLWKNGEPVARLGWKAGHTGREAVLGAFLFVPLVYLTILVERVLVQAGVPAPSTPTPAFFDVSGRGEMFLALILVAVVAVTEESIFRGYLILRLGSVTRSLTAAVILSSVIFSLGHGYEGTLGVATVGFMGLVFALIYLWRGSLVAPTVMHFLQDFFSILVLPLLGSHGPSG